MAIIGLVSLFAFREWNKRRQAKLAKASALRLKQDRQHLAPKKEARDPKPKRQRIEEATPRESYAAKLKAQPASQPYQVSYSSDDDVDNREFARQLNSVKVGTKFAAKAKDDTKQKSVKQSRAQEMPERADNVKVSAPSSTAGIDADDDQSRRPLSPPLKPAASQICSRNPPRPVSPPADRR